MSTGFAEYAMTTSHATYNEHWERTLENFGAPRRDIWPRKGLRPDWWPTQWAGARPYNRSVPEHYAALMREDLLAQLTQHLSLGSDSSCTAWLRLGPKGDVQLPGRPANDLGQLSEWVLAPDAGMRKTRREVTSGDKEAVGRRRREALARSRMTCT